MFRTHTCRFALRLYLGALVCLPAAGHAASRWLPDFITREGTESPNGRYAMTIPKLDSVQDDDDAAPNYLADLQKHVFLGRVEASHYFERRNHYGLTTTWAADSSWAAVVFTRRYGFDTITAVEIAGDKISQIEIGKQVHASINAVVARQTGDKDDGADAGVTLHLSANRKLQVRAIANTNPKQFENVKTYRVLFLGTYDLKARKWTTQDARSIRSEEDEQALWDISEKLDMDGYGFPSVDRKLEWLDERLNSVYRALKLLHKPERFAEIKAGQIAWLKQQDAAASTEEKCKALEARTRELQALSW